MTIRTLTSTVDPLTDEQIRKRATGVEDVDMKGLVKRHRVLDQTLFDLLFLKELIDQSQHEAAHLFMDSIAKSGASVRSANLNVEVFTPYRDIGNAMGERRMAFSSAYRAMVEDVGPLMADLAMRYSSDPYRYPAEYDEQKRVGVELGSALDSLARHYGTSDIHDPRKLIRVFVVGSGEKK